MPIEPPDPLLPLDLLATVNDPDTSWDADHVIDSSVSPARHLYLHVETSTAGSKWKLTSDPTGYAHITEADFATLIGARDPQPDGTYTADDGTLYSLHLTPGTSAAWAVATRHDKSA